MDSSINYRNKYKMSKERRSTCRVSKHFRDILADANYTIHKLENMQCSQAKLQGSVFRKRVEGNAESIFGQQRCGKIHKTLKIIENKVENGIKEFENGFQSRLQSRKDLEMDKLKTRVEVLKRRIQPHKIAQGKKLEFKIKEIQNITKTQLNINSKNMSYTSQKNSPNTKFRKKTIKQTDYKEIQKDFWKKLSEEIKLKPSTIDVIRANRINLLMRRTLDSQEDIQTYSKIHSKQSIQHRDNLSLHKVSQSAFSLQKQEQRQSKHRNRKTFNTSFHLSNQKQKTTIHSPKINELEEWDLIRYLKQKQKRKNFVNSISKEVIQNENAIKIYSLVKGGYPVDSSEVQGDFISLARFNEARNEFATLNWMYKTVKEQVSSKTMKSQVIYKENQSNTFKRLVQINELSQKIPRNQLHKLMKESKIVN